MLKLLRFLTFILAPVRYPYAGLYHFAVGATWLFRLSGAHRPVTTCVRVLAGGWCGVLVGLVGVLVLGYLLARVEEREVA